MKRTAAVLMAVGAAAALAAEAPRSGYEYLGPENQALQDDAFANPGMLWVERGRALWREAPADADACAGCHSIESMRTVANVYPAFDARSGKLMSLEQRINRCRAEHQDAPAFAYESEPLLALTALLGHQAHGEPVSVTVTAQTQPFWEAGRRFYERRRGQLDLACRHCHERHAGDRLRGEVISEGHSNGYPAYRHVWNTLGSTHRLFQWCNEAVRAEPFAPGSDEYVNLEYYLRWRGQGLEIETPAVRR